MKVKTTFLAALLVLLAQHISAQISIHGKITDWQTLEPVAGASVYLSDLKTGAATDANGY